MEQKKLKLINRIVLITISVIVLGVVVYKANPVEFFTHDLDDLDLPLLGMVVVLYLVNTFCKSTRWAILLQTHNKSIRLFRVIPIFLMGLVTNNITPGRIAGDPVRAAILSKRSSSHFGHSFSTVVVEKGIDLSVLTLYGLVGTLIILPTVGMLVGGIMLAVLGLAMAGLMLFFAFMFSSRLMGRAMELGKKTIPIPAGLRKKYGDRTGRILGDFRGGSKTIGRSPGHFAASLLLTGIIWFNEFFRLWLILKAMHVDGVGVGEAMLASSLATLFGIFLPMGAGNSLIISAVYTQTGVSMMDASRAGMIMIGTSTWLSFVLGLASMWLTFGTEKKKDGTGQK